jgi:hypothetical protein
MMGKSGRGGVQMGPDFTNGQRIVSGAHKKAKDFEAGIVAKGGERAGGFLMCCHETQTKP